MKALPSVTAWLIGLVTVALAVLVALGMVSGINPQFERGRSPTSSVVAQEILGALALTALVVVAGQLPAVARGERLGSALGLLLLALLLAVVWLFGLLAERAS